MVQYQPQVVFQSHYQSVTQLPPKTVDKAVDYLWVSLLKPINTGVVNTVRFLSPTPQIA